MKKVCNLLVLITYVYHNARFKKTYRTFLTSSGSGTLCYPFLKHILQWLSYPDSLTVLFWRSNQVTSLLSSKVHTFFINVNSKMFGLCLISTNSGFSGLEVAGSNPAEAVGFLRVNKNPQHVGRAWLFVCCDCCVLSGRGLCDELITRSEESYRLWCVVECDLETS